MNPPLKHIFLCGFMGCGKSTHGKKLAAKMKMPFIDLDQFIESKEGRRIQDIFSKEGEQYFRQLESKYLQELLLTPLPHVISLGGGTVCFNNNIETILENGLLIYIEMSAAALAQRLKASSRKRPLLKQVKEADLPTFISSKLEERVVFYNRAHLRINGVDLNKDQLHHAIEEYLKQN